MGVELSHSSASLNANYHYRLRLLAEQPRCYRSDTILSSMARRGLIALTGSADDAGRKEWAITATGRAALAAAGRRR
jgi:hypothetical protein